MIHYKCFDSYAQLPSDWDRMAAHDIFLQTSYLKALEAASPKTIVLYYIAIFDAHHLIGIAILQRVALYAKNMFKIENTDGSTKLKKVLTSVLKGNVLVVGNITHTGQHGIFYNVDHISQAKFLNVLFEAIDNRVKFIKTQSGKAIRAIVFKDYFANDALHNAAGFLNQKGFYKFDVQPNMVMAIPSQWIDHTDYIAALSKKYKTRYKRAKKKLGSIKREELSEEAIYHNAERLYQLYITVSNNASFNTFILPQNHFFDFKRHLDENFKVFAYYLEDKIVGFFTLIKNNDRLETYFLGYDVAYQTEHQLYLNMLYDMIAIGVEHQFKYIVFARTAMEIKSSVGAIPKPMSIYLKHTNPLVNALVQPLFKLMDKKHHWEKRHPFENGDNS